MKRSKALVVLANCWFLTTVPIVPAHQRDDASPAHIRAHILAKQESPYDWGVRGDGPDWQTLMIQRQDQFTSKNRFASLAIIRYEFYSASEPALPDTIKDFGQLWEFDGVRTPSCDQNVRQLHYGAVEKLPSSEGHLRILHVNHGAEKLVPKPSPDQLPCFTVRFGQFRQSAIEPRPR
jgi:hypothetical protein